MFFLGQVALVIYSKYEIVESKLRIFLSFLWKNMLKNLILYSYSEAVVDVFCLSSKNYIDVTVSFYNGKIVFVLSSHVTLTVFDTEADENGRMNANRIRF